MRSGRNESCIVKQQIIGVSATFIVSESRQLLECLFHERSRTTESLQNANWVPAWCSGRLAISDKPSISRFDTIWRENSGRGRKETRSDPVIGTVPSLSARGG